MIPQKLALVLVSTNNPALRIRAQHVAATLAAVRAEQSRVAGELAAQKVEVAL